MNHTQTKDEGERTKGERKVKPAFPLDELCKTCNHMFRNHVWGKSCGVYPCECDLFVSTGIFYDWVKGNG